MPTALIAGITGQDGSYLAELLLCKGYEVWGIKRRGSSHNSERIDNIFDDLHLVYGDMADGTSLRRALDMAAPDEVYNLAAQSHVGVSFEMPEYTADVGGLGTLRLLEAIKETGAKCRFYQAATSEMFGSSPPPQNEETPFHPRSPYAVGKVAAYWHTVNYREAYGLHASNGILFNHESPRRGPTFVTSKVVRAAVNIKRGLQSVLRLGNLDACRDWGYAGDYVQAMWLMLQRDTPDDYVIATGKMHSIRDLLDIAFGALDLDWLRYVEVSAKYRRPAEVDALCGDASKARRVLGWEATTTFKELIHLMLEAEMSNGSPSYF